MRPGARVPEEGGRRGGRRVRPVPVAGAGVRGEGPVRGSSGEDKLVDGLKVFFGPSGAPFFAAEKLANSSFVTTQSLTVYGMDFAI